jgi:iron complex transport system substrate-binding protein
MLRERHPLLLSLLLAAALGLAACSPTVTATPTAALAAATATSAPPSAAAATTAAGTPTLEPATAAPATVTAIPATATPASITLVDSLSRTVTLAGAAKHVVSLAPSNTEILYALGEDALVAGRDDYSDYPPQVTQVPSIGNEAPHVNTEAVVALHPDLVLAAGVTSPEDVSAMEKLGLTVYATSNAASLDDIYHDILAVGTLVGATDKANALVDSMRQRVGAVATKLAGVKAKPIVFYELDATDPSKPWTAGPGSFVDQLIALAGGTNAGDIAKDQYVQLSLEQLVSENPDMIVLGSANFGGQTPELVAARPGWQGIKAVQNHAVYTFDDNLVSRPGPRVVEGLEKLAQLIHPELFK